MCSSVVCKFAQNTYMGTGVRIEAHCMFSVCVRFSVDLCPGLFENNLDCAHECARLAARFCSSAAGGASCPFVPSIVCFEHECTSACRRARLLKAQLAAPPDPRPLGILHQVCAEASRGQHGLAGTRRIYARARKVRIVMSAIFLQICAQVRVCS